MLSADALVNDINGIAVLRRVLESDPLYAHRRRLAATRRQMAVRHPLAPLRRDAVLAS